MQAQARQQQIFQSGLLDTVEQIGVATAVSAPASSSSSSSAPTQVSAPASSSSSVSSPVSDVVNEWPPKPTSRNNKAAQLKFTTDFAPYATVIREMQNAPYKTICEAVADYVLGYNSDPSPLTLTTKYGIFWKQYLKENGKIKKFDEGRKLSFLHRFVAQLLGTHKEASFETALNFHSSQITGTSWVHVKKYLQAFKKTTCGCGACQDSDPLPLSPSRAKKLAHTALHLMRSNSLI